MKSTKNKRSRSKKLAECYPKLYDDLHAALDWWIDNNDVNMCFTPDRTGGGNLSGPILTISRPDTEKHSVYRPVVYGFCAAYWLDRCAVEVRPEEVSR